MPVYVCISFVTYEHPLYRFIVLHRGRFVYCPFLLVRFTFPRGAFILVLYKDMQSGVKIFAAREKRRSLS